jgi:twinkle protein
LSEFTYEYLPLRGITRSTLEFYGVKTKINLEGQPVSLGFRYPNGSYKVRLLDKKEFYTEGEITKVGLFGRDKFEAGSGKFITITEGELDALSLFQVIRSPVVSVQSSSSALRDCTVDRDFLQSFDRIYLAFDNDAAGREALRTVAKLFDYNKVFQVKFTKRKDANEYLQAGEDADLLNVWKNARKYLPESIISTLSDFKEILKKEPEWGVPYPFPTLTAMTYGIKTGESVLITAQEGVGKTELMHAIEYQLLKETDDAIGAIFIEEPSAKHLRALASIALQKPVHLPDSGISSDQVIDALQGVVKVDDRLHVYVHFGSDDPEILLDIIRFLVCARGCRYILLDHLSMVVSGISSEKDERRALDYLTTRLETMVVELDFGLIMVSHVNDQGQTRGSRNASKIANIRIDISRNLLHPDMDERNTTNIVVSKNRFGMKTGPAGRVTFDPNTYTYKEQTHDQQVIV